MHKYSDFFQTLHDERTRTGNLGRGTHYSILRAVVFGDSAGKPTAQAQFADFAVIWDEDHDDRVIEAIEKTYFAGILPNFLMFGERKGILTAVLADGITEPKRLIDLDTQLNGITKHLLAQDSWVAQAFPLDHYPHNPIIDGSSENVKLYLSNLKMLWELGLKTAIYEGPSVG
jgi:hypothetical protein